MNKYTISYKTSWGETKRKQSTGENPQEACLKVMPWVKELIPVTDPKNARVRITLVGGERKSVNYYRTKDWKTLFVYPTIDFRGEPALQIQTECEDGKIWFGIDTAIEAYCDERCISDIECILFQVKFTDDINDDYVTFKAKSGKDFASKMKKYMKEHNLKFTARR